MTTCKLETCQRVFKPKTRWQKFCSVKHREQWHQRQRQLLIEMARKMTQHVT